jgi:hypothetical protein
MAMVEPRTFFDTYVVPAVHAWQRDPRNERLAIQALNEIDNLAEHVIKHVNPKASVKDERDKLAAIRPSLGLARDAHDSHKHGILGRKNAKITKGQRPQVVSFGGAVGSAPVGVTPVGGSLEELTLVLDDGSQHSVVGIITHCMDFWHAELARLEI